MTITASVPDCRSTRLAAVAAPLVASLALLAPGTVLACRCVPPPPPLEAAEASDAVFHGTVVEVIEVDEFDLRVTFTVQAVWKGPLAPALEVRTANNSAACGYVFDAGAEYIVYAFQSPETGLNTNTCTRTRPYEAEEAKALGDPIDSNPGAVSFWRGDANGDGNLDLSDSVFTLGYLFLGGATPNCLKSADTDDSGAIDLSDAVYVLNHLFQGGPGPSAPYPDCGADSTADDLGCEVHPPCQETV